MKASGITLKNQSSSSLKTPPCDDKPNLAGVSAFSDVLSQLEGSPAQSVDHVVNNDGDWESLARELEFHDYSNPLPLSNNCHLDQFSALPEFPPSHSSDPTHFIPSDFALSHAFPRQNFGMRNEFDHANEWNAGSHMMHELVRAAESIESNQPHQAKVILARLSQQLESPTGEPLRRAAFYFKEALQSLLPGSTRSTRPSSSFEIVQTIKAYRSFADVSPITMFSNFTANQAILEAANGSMLIHVIDFDIGLGGHWSSFMKEIADRATPPVLRITAVVPEEYAMELRLIGENLNLFARELEIGFQIDFVSTRTFEFLSFRAVKIMEGEKTAVLLSPAILRRIGAGFLSDLRRASPHVVVYVDGEGSIGATSSLRGAVINGLEFYTTVLKSLEEASTGGWDEWIWRIEVFLLRPKIFAAVEAEGRHAMPWREALAGAGMRPVALSQFADFQAECLLRKSRVKGFHVAKGPAEMVLCWHDKALVSTSAWRC